MNIGDIKFLAELFSSNEEEYKEMLEFFKSPCTGIKKKTHVKVKEPNVYRVVYED